MMVTAMQPISLLPEMHVLMSPRDRYLVLMVPDADRACVQCRQYPVQKIEEALVQSSFLSF
jgi:lysyl-tRNA synthetase class II